MEPTLREIEQPVEIRKEEEEGLCQIRDSNCWIRLANKNPILETLAGERRACNTLHFLLHFLRRACNKLLEVGRLLWSEVVYQLHSSEMPAAALGLEGALAELARRARYSH